MSKTIYKYPFQLSGQIDLTLPVGAEIVKVDMQGGRPTMWAIVDPDAVTIWRRFMVLGTGNTIPEHTSYTTKFIATFFSSDGAFVWHLFEKIYKETKGDL